MKKVLILFLLTPLACLLLAFVFSCLCLLTVFFIFNSFFAIFKRKKKSEDSSNFLMNNITKLLKNKGVNLDKMQVPQTREKEKMGISFNWESPYTDKEGKFKV